MHAVQPSEPTATGVFFRAEHLSRDPQQAAVGLLVQAVLQRNGWVITDYSMCKTYSTAVGPKDALAQLLFNSRADDPNWTLSGQYYSEGNNCLGNQGVLIPKASSDAEVCRLAEQFALQAAAAIAQTYAVRLLKH